MSITIDGSGTISGVSSTGLTTAQLVNAANITSGTLPYAQLPTGSVLQVIYANYGTQKSNNTSTFVDTGLSASITPKYSTSKILVLASINGVYKDTLNTYVKLQLLRDSTIVSNMEQYGAYTGNTAANDAGASSINFLDSPSSTSSILYKIQFSSGSNLQGAFVQTNSSNSTMVLMEIAG